MRRIVVGVDGSGESVAALRWACREASLRGGEVHAVHVREAKCRSLASYAVPARYAVPAPSRLPAKSEPEQTAQKQAEQKQAEPGQAAQERAEPGQVESDGSTAFDIDEMVRSVQPDLAPGTQVHAEVADGLAARVLLERCAGADMLVLGTVSDESGASRSAGPVIRACLRRAPCAVVVISIAQDPARYRESARRPGGARARAAVPAIAGV